MEQEVLDSDLLLEKSALLEKEGRIDEFLDTVRTLLSQHCPIIRDRDEAKCESAVQNPSTWLILDRCLKKGCIACFYHQQTTLP